MKFNLEQTFLPRNIKNITSKPLYNRIGDPCVKVSYDGEWTTSKYHSIDSLRKRFGDDKVTIIQLQGIEIGFAETMVRGSTDGKRWTRLGLAYAGPDATEPDGVKIYGDIYLFANNPNKPEKAKEIEAPVSEDAMIANALATYEGPYATNGLPIMGGQYGFRNHSGMHKLKWKDIRRVIYG